MAYAPERSSTKPDLPVARHVVPVILSGGAGTRLWPVSRETAPKPFMPVRGSTLLRRTFDRAAQVHGCTHTLVVTNQAYAAKTRTELDPVGHGAYTMLLEPIAQHGTRRGAGRVACGQAVRR